MNCLLHSLSDYTYTVVTLSSSTTMPAMMTLRVHTESLRVRTVMAFAERENGGIRAVVLKYLCE